MIDLNAPVWKTLSAAGNDADKWLRCLLEGNGDIRENITILAEDLSHQLSYYSATAYALPHLAAFCAKLSTEDKIFLIAQIGAAIAAESYDPLQPQTEAYEQFMEGLTGLRSELAALMQNTKLENFLTSDIGLGQEFALSALSILGDRKHAYAIYLMSGSCWEEWCAACTCGWNDETLLLSDQPECFKPIQIDVWDGKSLTDEAVWFYGLLELAGDEEIKPIVPLLYGTGICPNCGKQEPYWAWFDRFMEDY